MKKRKGKLMLRRMTAMLLSFLIVLSIIPVTALADGGISSVSNIDIDITEKYGHELHTTTINGTTYPLFCIEYGTKSPSSSYAAGNKEKFNDKALEAARWVFIGYYMEHGNSINWLDMACCQKKVWEIMGDNVSWNFSDSYYESWCDNAKANERKLTSKPSFDGKNVGTFRAGTSTTITDTKGVLKEYPAFTDNKDGIKIVHRANENTLTITIDKACTKTSFSILTNKYRKTITGNDDDLIMYYPDESASYQKLIYSAYFDPVSFAVKGNVEPLSHLTIRKTSEDNKKNFTFNVKGNGINQNITTDAKTGIATLNYIPKGTYTVTEISETPYVENKPQTKTVAAGKTVTFDFYNTLKKFKIEVNKEDVDVKVAQGDATLQGAKYELYNNGKLVDTYITDKNGEFTTAYEICGDNWTLKELEPSEGYLLNDTVYKIPAGAKNFTLERNTIKQTVTETPIKAQIAVIKHSNTCDEQIETPEQGAEFQIYLKSKGSYEASAAYERDIIVTDENGFAETKKLPYGTYTVHQTKGLDGTKYVSDFNVYISTDGEVYRYLLNNPPFRSYLKITKLDIETGKPITSSSAGYQIYDPDGNLVTMRFTYPTPTTIDTFYTNSEGYLVTPEKLPYGKGYKLVEVQAPYGYVLDSTPIEFDVTQSDSSEEDELTIVTVAQKNNAQKGVIEISKTGEIFASVENNEDFYTPLYEEQGLIGAEFEIYAAEDIITGDGTVRAEKGSLVDTITTGSDGIAKSQQLYLGEYIVKEVKAPYSFVLDETAYDVVLTYAGQDVKVTSTTLSSYNQRQTSDISLAKILEQNEDYSVGMNGEIENVKFGLYSTDIVTAQDESQIPADGLITSAHCDNEGKIVFDCDLPIGFNWYVQEIETDEHYILSDEKYDFSTEYQGQEIQTINIEFDEIINDLKTGEVQGIKLDDSGDSLAGAVIGIFKYDTEKFTADTAVKTTISADDGAFSFLDIPMGKYIVKEITAPDDYLIDPNNYVIDLTDNKQIVTLEIVNVLKRGDIQGTKVDDNGNALAGAVIGLFNADTTEFTEETALMTVTSDENGSFSFKNIPVGKYIVKELKAPKGYIINNENFEADLTDDGQVIEIKIVNKKEKKSPYTGFDMTDSNDQIIFASSVLSICAMAALATLRTSKKKKQKKSNY